MITEAMHRKRIKIASSVCISNRDEKRLLRKYSNQGASIRDLVRRNRTNVENYFSNDANQRKKVQTSRDILTCEVRGLMETEKYFTAYMIKHMWQEYKLIAGMRLYNRDAPTLAYIFYMIGTMMYDKGNRYSAVTREELLQALISGMTHRVYHLPGNTLRTIFSPLMKCADDCKHRKGPRLVKLAAIAREAIEKWRSQFRDWTRPHTPPRSQLQQQQ